MKSTKPLKAPKPKPKAPKSKAKATTAKRVRRQASADAKPKKRFKRWQARLRRIRREERQRAAHPEQSTIPRQTTPDEDLLEIARALPVAVKAALTCGDNFWFTHADPAWGIESIRFSDGPHGLRVQAGPADHLGLNASLPATCFPSESTTACSFDPALLAEIGRAVGEECRAMDVQVLLGPGLNIKRHPLCGRNFEYFSEDPLLTGMLGAAFIRGLAAEGVGACPKHFAANSQEKARMASDSLVDDRALSELYLRGFEIAVRAGKPATIMSAYNRLNGSYCCENSELLIERLRDRWGFEGAVVTDWGGMSESVASVAAGLDLCMPGPRPDHCKAIETAVADGSMDEEDLNLAAAEVLRLSLAYPSRPAIDNGEHLDEHLALAARAAEESAVLLVNHDLLPLPRTARVAVIGAFAAEPRFQGAGSSKLTPIRLDNTLDGLRALGADVLYAPAYDPVTGETDDDRLAEAIATAELADYAVVFVGLPDRFESEGLDRSTLALPDAMNDLVVRICAANARTAVVIQSGSCVEVPWRKRPGAILLAGLGGCQGGRAMARLLLGDANPSGKLAESWPARLSDTALGEAFPDQHREIRYRESLFVGYRYYDAAGVDAAFPFGHGLSYTTFAYDDLRVSVEGGVIVATCAVTNTGTREGCEIVQCYGGPDGAAEPVHFSPPRQLAGFARVPLTPGETREVRIVLDPRALAHWDRDTQTFAIEAGAYQISVGASSRDLRCFATLALRDGESLKERFGDEDTTEPLRVVEARPLHPVLRALLEPYYTVEPHRFPDASFKALYGRPEPAPLSSFPATLNTVVSDMRATPLGLKMYKLMHLLSVYFLEDSDESIRAMSNAMLDDMPLRALMMSGINYNQLMGLVRMLNGEPGRGALQVLRATHFPLKDSITVEKKS